MKKIKSNKLDYSKKTITELTKKDLSNIIGGSAIDQTFSVYTGNANCGVVMNILKQQ